MQREKERLMDINVYAIVITLGVFVFVFLMEVFRAINGNDH
jgi:hypothetical protein